MVPTGLIRHGVAPDSDSVKQIGSNIIRRSALVNRKDFSFRFLGGVDLVSIAEFAENVTETSGSKGNMC